jgi:hypothetical protein
MNNSLKINSEDEKRGEKNDQIASVGTANIKT